MQESTVEFLSRLWEYAITMGRMAYISGIFALSETRPSHEIPIFLSRLDDMK